MNEEPLVPLGDLPGRVRDEICATLDSSVKHSWVKLIENIPDHNTFRDLLELRGLADRRLSPSEELLKNLGSEGWDVLALGRAAQRAGLQRVVDIIAIYLEEEGIEVNLQEDPPPEQNRFAAKSCLSRSRYPTEIEPPTEALEEARRRYNLPDSPAPPPYSAVEYDRRQKSASVFPGPGSTCDKQAEILRTTSPTNTGETTPPIISTHQATPISLGISSSHNSPLDAGIYSNEIRTVNCSAAPSESTSQGNASGTTSSTSIRRSFSPPPDNLEEVRYETIMNATENFNRTPYKDGGHKVGDGGFGEVFQCWLPLLIGRVHAAVKVLQNQNSGSADSVDTVDRKQFSTEIQALSRLSHKCLLAVLGYSYDGPRLCLIYPFMCNGSLELHLSDHTSFPPPTRLMVATDIAEGLDYLHFKAENTIIHRDIKSANVLLTDEWRGKLGDFGLARLLSSQQPDSSVIHTATIVGTRVYMAPETNHGKISRKADVYSFGVVLFELLTGRCALSNILDDDGEETDLITYIEDQDQDDSLALNVGGWELELWQKLWALAKCCLKRLQRRPSSSEVLEELIKFNNS